MPPPRWWTLLVMAVEIAVGAVLIWLFPLVCLTYGLAKVVVARRYR